MCRGCSGRWLKVKCANVSEYWGSTHRDHLNRIAEIEVYINVLQDSPHRGCPEGVGGLEMGFKGWRSWGVLSRSLPDRTPETEVVVSWVVLGFYTGRIVCGTAEAELDASSGVPKCSVQEFSWLDD